MLDSVAAQALLGHPRPALTIVATAEASIPPGAAALALLGAIAGDVATLATVVAGAVAAFLRAVSPATTATTAATWI